MAVHLLTKILLHCSQRHIAQERKSIYIVQGSKLVVAWSPNASENSGGRVKTLPLLVRRGVKQIFLFTISWVYIAKTPKKDYF